LWRRTGTRTVARVAYFARARWASTAVRRIKIRPGVFIGCTAPSTMSAGTVCPTETV